MNVPNKYQKIVDLLNSPDLEIIILGLDYLKEKSNLIWSPGNAGNVFISTLSKACESTKDLILENLNGVYHFYFELECMLDDIIWNLRDNNPFDRYEFINYKSRGAYETCG